MHSKTLESRVGFSLFQIIRSPSTKCKGGFGEGLRGPGSDDRGDGGVSSSLHLLQLGLKSLDLCTGTAPHIEGKTIEG